jgi:hypothetical protein
MLNLLRRSRSLVCWSFGVALTLACSSGQDPKPKADMPSAGSGGSTLGSGGFGGSGGSAGARPATAGSVGVAGGDAGSPGGDAGSPGMGGMANGRPGISVRFVGLTDKASPLELPGTPDLAEQFPGCPSVPSSELAFIQVYTECIARGVVDRMNQKLADLVDEPPFFVFESFEVRYEPELAVFATSSTQSNGWQLGKLEGPDFRKPNTMTFVMPRSRAGDYAGLALQGQRLNPDFGMLAIAVADAGPGVLLHEFGHALGFPHIGELATVGTVSALECDLSVTPEACTCEPDNFMWTGAFEPSGCPKCTSAVSSNTYDTPLFGPFFKRILECWIAHRLEPSPIQFIDAECAAIGISELIPCNYDDNQQLICTCPSGTKFPVDTCLDEGQDARNAAADAACEALTCPVPANRPDVACTGLVGAKQIECICSQNNGQRFYATECSQVQAGIDAFCPPP